MRRLIFPVICVIVALASPRASGADEGDISVRVEVESRDVYMGESFIMQIVVDGSDRAGPPDLSSLEGFSVESLGGSNKSSQSFTIINGRMQRTVTKEYVFSYRLTAGRPGRLTIPSLGVKVEGKTFSTQPVTVAVRRPEETEDFKLRIELSREVCFVGEPVILTVTWYLHRDVHDFRFTAPIFRSDDFVFEDPEIKIDRRKKYFRIAIDDGEVIAEKGKAILDGDSYATLTFSKALIPKRSGTFVIPEVIVACESGVGFRGRGDMFNDFFSEPFFDLRRGRIKKYVVPSNTLDLSVKELPLGGRPDGFFGHVGEYRISSSAEPVEVNVGDPITLKIAIEGPDYLGAIDLPPLTNTDDFNNNFKIPDERADGKIEGRKKIFTQTIRAKHDQVREIPPVRLVYFDTKKEQYLEALSEPIPLVVHETKVVTALDAEGMEPGLAGAPIEKWKGGIAFNYEGADIVVPQDFGLIAALTAPPRLISIILAPALYLILLMSTLAVKRRRADPEARKARSAQRRLRNRLESIGKSKELSRAQVCEGVMEALKIYLGDKLHCSGSTLTPGDVERMLEERGVEPDVIRTIGEVIYTCEAGAYAGDLTAVGDRENLIKRAREAARMLEKNL